MRFLLLGFLLLLTTPGIAQAPGQYGIVLLVPTLEKRLLMEQHYKNLMLFGGDIAYAAYFAGRESVYRELLADIDAVVNPK